MWLLQQIKENFIQTIQFSMKKIGVSYRKGMISILAYNWI